MHLTFWARICCYTEATAMATRNPNHSACKNLQPKRTLHHRAHKCALSANTKYENLKYDFSQRCSVYEESEREKCRSPNETFAKIVNILCTKSLTYKTNAKWRNSWEYIEFYCLSSSHTKTEPEKEGQKERNARRKE